MRQTHDSGRTGYGARMIAALFSVVAAVLCRLPSARGQCGPSGVEMTGPLEGAACNFNGTDQSIQLPNGSFFTGGDFTVEGWVRPARHRNWQRMLDMGNGAPSDNIVMSASYEESGRPVFEIFNGGTSYAVVSPNAIPTNTWTHLAGTYNAGTRTMRLYINFVEVGSLVNVPPPNNVFRTRNYIGRSNWNDALFQGNIAVVRIWREALIPAIFQYWSQLSVPPPNNVVAEWMLNEVRALPGLYSSVWNSAAQAWDTVWQGSLTSTTVPTIRDSYMRGVADRCRMPVFLSQGFTRGNVGATGGTLQYVFQFAGADSAAFPIASDSQYLTVMLNGDVFWGGRTDSSPNGRAWGTILNVGPLREGNNEIYVRSVNLLNPSLTAESPRLIAIGRPALRIRTSPASVGACVGSAAAFSVDAVGDNLTYQWMKDGVAIAGATASTLVLPSVAGDQAGGYTVRVGSGTSAVVSSPAAVLSVVDSADCSPISAFYSPLVATEVVRSEYGRVNSTGSSPNRKPRVAAVATAIGEVAALNANATLDQLTAFANAYDAALRGAFPDDPDLRRAVNFLAAVGWKGRLASPVPPASGALDPLIGLNTNVGLRVLGTLGIDVDEATRQGDMVQFRLAYALDFSSSREFAAVLVRGFRGQDAAGRASAIAGSALTAYLRSQGIEPYPATLGNYPEVAQALMALPRTPGEFADALSHGFASERSRVVDQLGNMTRSLADNIGALRTIDVQQANLLTAINGGSSSAVTQQIIARRQLEAQQQFGPRASIAMLTAMLRQGGSADVEFANQAEQLWETQSKAIRSTAAIGQALMGAGSIYQQIGLWGQERFSASSLTSGVGGLATGAAILFSMFGPSPAADIVSDIINPIGAVQAQIAALRAEMNARFDRVDAKLDNVLDTVQQGFSAVTIGQHLTLDRIGDLQLGISSIQSDLMRLEGNLYGILSDGFEQQLLVDLNYAIGYRDQYNEDLSYTTGSTSYSSFSSEFATWATQLSQNQVYGGREGTLINDGNAGRMLSVVTDTPNQPGAPQIGSPLPLGAAINNLRTFPATMSLPMLSNTRLSNPNTWAFATSGFAKLARENPWYFAKAYGNAANLQPLLTEGARSRDAMLSVRRSGILARLIADARTRATGFDAALASLAQTIASEAQSAGWDMWSSVDVNLGSYPNATLPQASNDALTGFNIPTQMQARFPAALQNAIFTHAIQANGGTQGQLLLSVRNPRQVYNQRILIYDFYSQLFDFDITVRKNNDPSTDYVAYRETYMLSSIQQLSNNLANDLRNSWNGNQGGFVRVATVTPQYGRLIADMNARQLQFQQAFCNRAVAGMGTTGTAVFNSTELLESSRALLDAYISIGLPVTLDACDSIRAFLHSPEVGLGRDALVATFAAQSAASVVQARTQAITISGDWNARLDSLSSMLSPTTNASYPNETHPQLSYAVATLEALRDNAPRLLSDDSYVVAPGQTLSVSWRDGLLANDATQALDLELRRVPQVDLSRLPAGHSFSLRSETRDLGQGVTRQGNFGGFVYTPAAGFTGDVVLTYTASVDLSTTGTPNIVASLPADIWIRVTACAPSLTATPASATLRVGGITTFDVGATAPTQISYQWRRNGVALHDGTTDAGSYVLGSGSPRLMIVLTQAADQARYDCVVATSCGSVVSSPATLGNACAADVDDGSGSGTPDGGVTIDDLLYYLAIYTAGVSRADVDDGSGTGTPDGGVTIDDLLYFLDRYSGGC